jgi:intron-binding protein aquarius
MMNRESMKKSGLRFTAIIVDSANQMIDLETLLCLTAGADTHVKRMILVGDDKQLGPVSSGGRSLFTRMSLLGAPSETLVNMTDCNSTFIGSLIADQYASELVRVVQHVGIPGMVHDCQFIHVPGKGEIEPSPNMFQNLSEAEFVVALYMYLRLRDIPASSVSILAAYTGQKSLLLDIIKAKCEWNPIFGQPRDVVTIDQFQGQTNDIVLVSTVRSEIPGHMRDFKRWITAIGSAKKGLYIFGNLDVLSGDVESEVKAILRRLTSRPTKLALALDGSMNSSILNSTDDMLELLQTELQKELRKTRI